MGKYYRMKAESGGAVNLPEVQPTVLTADVGSLREVLSRLPADMPVRISVQGSDVGVCQLAHIDVRATDLVLSGAKAS